MSVVIAGPIVSPDHEHPGHPERPPRVDAAAAGIDDLGLGADRVDAPPRRASFDELAAVHDPAYLRALESFCEAGGGKLDPDTYARPTSWDAACEVAGAGLEAVDTKLRTTSVNAFLGEDALASERQQDVVAGSSARSGDRWGWYWWSWSPWSDIETYDDRVVFVARTLGAGAHTYSYLARATTPGRFVRPQALAEEMYNPALSGRSDGGWFVVKARALK